MVGFSKCIKVHGYAILSKPQRCDAKVFLRRTSQTADLLDVLHEKWKIVWGI